MNLKKSIAIALLLVSIVTISLVIAQTTGSPLWRSLRASNEAYSAYNAASDIVESLKETLEGLEKNKKASQNVFSTWMTHYLDAEEALTAKREEYNNAFDAYEAASNRVDAAESYIAGLEADLAYARNMLENIDSDSPSSGTQADYWRQKISDLESDLAMARSELESAKAEKNRTWSALNNIARQIPYLADERDRAKATADEAYKQDMEIAGQIADKKAEIAAAEADEEQKYQTYLELKAIYDALAAQEEDDD